MSTSFSPFALGGLPMKATRNCNLAVRYTDCMLLLLLVAGPLLAQNDTARIVGTITDRSGALVSGAAVAAVNMQTNATAAPDTRADRKSTRLNSSHVRISYAVFCLKKKNKSGPTC